MSNPNGRHPLVTPDTTDPILTTAEPIHDPEHDRHKGPHVKGPHDPKEINPKMSSDIAYWAHEFHISGEKLHEIIRVHGNHVEKVRAALHLQ